MPLTFEQQKATNPNLHLMVTAGAGSGKTRVLVYRLIRLFIEAQINPENALVVTFTRKAAGEMQQRIQATLQMSQEELLREFQIYENNQANFSELKNLTERIEKNPAVLENLTKNIWKCQIGTFHSFCASLLREYALEANLDANFSIIEEGEQYHLLAEAIQEALEEIDFSKIPEEAKNITQHFKIGKLKNIIFDMIQRRSELNSWVEFIKNKNENEILNYWLENYFPQQTSILKEWLKNDSEFLNILESFLEIKNKARDIKSSDYGFKLLSSVSEIYEEIIKSEFLARCLQFGFLLNLFLDNDGAWKNKESRSLIGLKGNWQRNKDLWELFKDKVSILSENYLNPLFKESFLKNPIFLSPTDKTAIQLLKGLIFFYEKAAQSYYDRKSSLGVQDYLDLELKAHQLLHSDDSWKICEELQQKFQAILVDEFQDTNLRQWQILTSILNPQQGKIFVVGDEKQAIYSFRGGDIATVQLARKEMGLIENFQELKKKMFLESQEIIFTDNFRSSENLITFYNLFFEKLFQLPEDFSDPNLPKIKVQKLESKREEEQIQGSVALWLIENPAQKTKKGANSLPEELVGHQLEAEILAKLLKDIFTGKVEQYQDITKLIKEKKKERKIAILLQRRRVIPFYERALRAYDLDFTTVGGVTFYDRNEVRDVLNLISILNNPYNDISLLGLLRSPLISLSDDAVFYISTRGGGSTAGNGDFLWDKINFLLENNLETSVNLSKDKKEEIYFAVKKLKKWREWVSIYPVPVLLDKIFDDALVELAYSDLSGSTAGIYSSSEFSQEILNLKKITEIVYEIWDSGLRGLNEVEEFLYNQQRRARLSEAEISEFELQSSIQIMTIHQAKGLEFPMVILPDLAASFSKGKTPSFLMSSLPNLKDPKLENKFELGIQIITDQDPTNKQDSTIRKLISLWIEAKNKNEKKRLFYVAATRAQNHLILFSQIDPVKDFKSKAEKEDSFKDWLLKILMLQPEEKPQSAYLIDENKVKFELPIHYISSANYIAKKSLQKEKPSMEIIDPEAAAPISDRVNFYFNKLKELLPSSQPHSLINSKEILNIPAMLPLFSVTALMDYRNCPYLFYLKHWRKISSQWLNLDPLKKVQKIEKFKDLIPEAAQVGQEFHRWVRTTYPGTDSEDDKFISRIEDAQIAQKVQKLIKNYRAHSLGANFCPAPHLDFRELPFWLPIYESEFSSEVKPDQEPAVILTGSIDRLVYDSEKELWLVIDYKTQEIANFEEISKIIQKNQYDFQMICYQEAAGFFLNSRKEKVNNSNLKNRADLKSIQAILFFCEKPYIYQLDFNANAYLEIQSSIKRLKNDLSYNNFSKKIQNCEFCSGKDFC